MNFEKQAEATLNNSQKSKQKWCSLVNHVKFNDYKTQEERRKVYQQVAANSYKNVLKTARLLRTNIFELHDVALNSPVTNYPHFRGIK